MIYCFDIDGVICHTEGMDYENAEPNHEVIERIKALHEEGHEVQYYTGRGGGHGGLERRARLMELSRKQLRKWGLPNNCDVWPKPPADVYVDDRAVNVRDWSAGRKCAHGVPWHIGCALCDEFGNRTVSLSEIPNP